MPPCHPFRPVPGQCGPNRRGPLPAPPFDPRDYWATRKCVSKLFASLETKLDKVDVVDPGAATEAGKAADAKSTYEELSRILTKLAKKADKATTLAGYGITDAATKTEIAAKADLVGGKVPAAQLPSYVDDVLEYDTMSAFPATGESGKIYVAKDANKTYRWSGTQYVEISLSPVLDDEVTEASTNGVKSSGIWSWVKSLLPHWLTSDYAEPATVASVATKADKTALDDKRDNDDIAVYKLGKSAFVLHKDGLTDVTLPFTGKDQGKHYPYNEYDWVYKFSGSFHAIVFSDGKWKLNVDDGLEYGYSSASEDALRIEFDNGYVATRSSIMSIAPVDYQQLAAVATGDVQTPADGDLVKYDAANDRFVKAIAGTDYIPFIKDLNDNKTAVTIGNRKSGESVGKYSLANGYNVTASGDASHAEGDSTTASGYYSHAEGDNTTASGNGSHAEGYYTHTKKQDYYAFAWNGDETRTTPYESNGNGTFNINPVGGLDGFYIGGQTLTQVINAVIAKRLSTVDPDNASVYDLIKALKGE